MAAFLVGRARRLVAAVRRASRCIRATLRVLWACRVSVFAVAAPALLLSTVQGRDLFSFYAGPLVEGSAKPDLLAARLYTILYWTTFTVLVVVCWCYPVVFSARLMLERPEWLFADRRSPSGAALRRAVLLHRGPIDWVPRLLAVAIFGVLAAACMLALHDLPNDTVGALDRSESSLPVERMLHALIVCFLVEAALVFLLLRRPGRRADRQPAPVGRHAPLPQRFAVAVGGSVLGRWEHRWNRIVFVCIGVLFLAVLALPSVRVPYLDLALLLPLAAGAWVPLFTLLALWGHRVRVPLIFAFLASVLGLTYLAGDHHDVSRAPTAARDPVTLADAVARWEAANCWNGLCPRPLIVSTAGGASRAAFFTLTVLGDLLDNPAFNDPRPAGDKALYVTGRLFAISAVSGGAVAAALFGAAVANSPDGRPPCRKTTSRFWFRAGAPANWRGCLQAMIAEDDLSPAMSGLFFRDNFGFLANLVPWPDRAVVLEQSLIDSFSSWIAPPVSDGLLGLDAGFTRFGPTAAAWRPLLVMNGTSVTTGRRILTTQLAPAFDPERLPGDKANAAAATGEHRLFTDSYDVFEVLAGPPGSRGATHCDGIGVEACDLRMVTAATNSARFPIISPPGTLRRTIDGRPTVVDRIVDGGYFENDGATTTMDLVHALVLAGLRPAVLHIANNPLPYPRRSSSLRNAAADVALPAATGPAMPRAEDRSWFPWLDGPLNALLATSDARATYALQALQDGMSEDSFAEVLVYGEPVDHPLTAEPAQRNGCIQYSAPEPDAKLREVSMSWWLSQPLQEYLDTQLKLDVNCAALDKVRRWFVDTPEPIGTAPSP